MNVNQEYINDNYKKIWETVTTNGEPVPYLLHINTPIEFQPSFKEREKVDISSEARKKLGEAYYNRRLRETQIDRENKGKKKRREALEKYLEDELIEFVKNYPQFKDVIQKKDDG